MDFSQRVIIFPHIPKSAGLSVAAAIERAIAPAQTLRLRMQKIENVRSSRLAEIGVNAHENWRRLADRLTTGHYLMPTGNTISDAKRAAFIYGHFCIGQEPDTGRKPLYISVVRDPVDRFLSYYYYRMDQLPDIIGAKKSHPLLDSTGKFPQTPMDYLDHLSRSGAKNWRNPQVRYFSRRGTFDAARSVISSTDNIIAPFTRLDLFIEKVADRIAASNIELAHDNRGTTRSKVRPELTTAERDRILQFFTEDDKLYRYTVECTERRQ